MTDAGWLEARRTGIGSSDCAAVCGVSPWATPLRVYLSKVDGVADFDSEAEELYWGRELEEPIARGYQQRTGSLVSAPLRRLERHPSVPWLLASLDRVVDAGMPKGRILECKNVRQKTEEWGEEGTGEVPDHYKVQVQHQMLVTGMLTADLAVLFGGCKLAVYTISRDESVHDHIRRMCVDFWARVVERRPPAPNWSHPETPDLVRRLHTPQPGLVVALENEAVSELAREYLARQSDIRWLTREKDVLQAQLIHAMGEAEQAILPGGLAVERKARHRRGYTVAATDYYQFRVLGQAILPDGALSVGRGLEAE